MRRLLPLVTFLALTAPAAANPIQHENARPGTTRWQIPQNAGTAISGYASETSVAPGDTLAFRVRAPRGSRYRVVVYRLGWYGGLGGRRLSCLPGCSASRAALAQPASSAPLARSGLIRTRWHTTDVMTARSDWVSGYYEAKLIVIKGPHSGAVGRIPFIVRESRPRAAVLIQAPVNTWQAYDTWGGKSLYFGSDGQRAFKVSFDRPYDESVVVPVVFKLELQTIRYLERRGVDLAYQTNVDLDRDPGSLLSHRLILSIGHDEYWSQRMRDAYDAALAHGTNLAFGSNAGLWRIRYEDHRRTVVEWRNHRDDPVHDLRYSTGEFRLLKQPECQLMAVQYEELAQRLVSFPATPYQVVGAATDPWLAPAGLAPGDKIDGVVGYEWDGYVPGCFRGRVEPLLHGAEVGVDGIVHNADAVRATAPSGARVFGMGTMELGWALDDFGGHMVDPRAQALVDAALADLTRPAPPVSVRITRRPRDLLVSARLSAADPRVRRVGIAPVAGGAPGCRDVLRRPCVLPLRDAGVPYTGRAYDAWGRSSPTTARGGLRSP